MQHPPSASAGFYHFTHPFLCFAVRAAQATPRGHFRFVAQWRRRNAALQSSVSSQMWAELTGHISSYGRAHASATSMARDVVASSGPSHARVRYATVSGEPRLLQGPRRLDERRAQADLEAMRAAAQNQPSRAEHFQTMADKEHETQVAMSRGKRRYGRQRRSQSLTPMWHSTRSLSQGTM